jgi:hypothetical protein
MRWIMILQISSVGELTWTSAVQNVGDQVETSILHSSAKIPSLFPALLNRSLEIYWEVK